MAYRVHIRQFDGPLDLLLHLIGRAEIDIADIFVSEITQQYLSYMDQLDEVDMDTASDFLAMAATLLYIKSRHLLPRPPREEAEDAQEDPEQALIRQLREYAPGDLVRGIHWKQSARTDKLLVKEFQKEEEEGVSLYLDFSGEKEPGPEEMSAFYQILSALLLGVLKEKAAVRVKWTDAQRRSLYRRVTTEEACMDLLLLLYDREETLFTKRPSGKGFKEDFTLNLNREIYYKEQCIHRFSLENCEREIKETKIILS